MKPRRDMTELALSAINRIPAMVAYWDAEQRCAFANNAYLEWFGRTPQEMIGISMLELLGPVIYQLNLPYIKAALAGKVQVFERKIPLPRGGTRESIATYIPDIADDEVRGFWVHVADVTMLRERETALEEAIAERDKALAEVRTLHGLLPICSYCKKIRDEEDVWQRLESYLHKHSEAKFTHGICPECLQHHKEIK